MQTKPTQPDLLIITVRVPRFLLLLLLAAPIEKIEEWSEERGQLQEVYCVCLSRC